MDCAADYSYVLIRYGEQVPSYEQSILEVSRRIRNKSQPPPSLISSSVSSSPSSSGLRRSASRPRNPNTPALFEKSYSTRNAYTKMFDNKRTSNTPCRGL